LDIKEKEKEMTKEKQEMLEFMEQRYADVKVVPETFKPDEFSKFLVDYFGITQLRANLLSVKVDEHAKKH
jgi:meiotically up-regulated gene 157 (Mug157) protein